MALTGNTLNQLSEDEHDNKNLKAKKASLLGYDATTDNLVRLGANSDGQLSVNQRDFDYIGISNSGDVDTLTYKTGGSGGTTLRTLTITYAAGAAKISDDLTSLEFGS